MRVNEARLQAALDRIDLSAAQHKHPAIGYHQLPPVGALDKQRYPPSILPLSLGTFGKHLPAEPLTGAVGMHRVKRMFAKHLWTQTAVVMDFGYDSGLDIGIGQSDTKLI